MSLIYIYIYDSDPWVYYQHKIPFFLGLFKALISGSAPHSSITYRNYIYYIHLYHH